MRFLPIFLLLACSGSPNKPSDNALPTDTDVSETDTDRTTTTPTDTDPVASTGDTGATVPTATGALVSANCVADPTHPFTGSCSLTLDTPGPVVVEVWESLDAVRTFQSDAIALQHEVPVGYMHADSTVNWRAWARDDAAVWREGTMQTAPLPPNFTFSASVTDTDGSVDVVWLAPGCPPSSLVAVDRAGEPVGWLDLAEIFFAINPFGPFVSAYDVTEAGTLVAILDRSHAVELSLHGEILQHFQRGVDFDNYLHHSIVGHEGRLYALQAFTVPGPFEDYILDGLYVFGPGGLEETWTIEGLWPLEPVEQGNISYWTGAFPNAEDFSHANSVHVDSSGDVYLSFRHLSAVVKLDGSAGFLQPEPLWQLVGDPSSVIDSDFITVGIDGSFSGQHSASTTSDGSLLMFDNRLQFGGTSRGLRFEIDDVAMVATAVDEYPIPSICPTQGGAVEVGPGRHLITCLAGAQVVEFAEGSTDEQWRMTPQCGAGVGIASRAVPFSP